MATGLQSWSKTAASNASADSNVNWAEGMAPSAVNDSSRGEMASAAKWRDDISGTITTTGSSTAYAITTNQGFATAAAMSGAMLTFIPHATSGASPTLAVDGLTARAINKSTGVAVATGSLIVGTPYTVTYIHATTEFILRDYTEVMGSPTFTGNLTVNGSSTLTGAVAASSTLNVVGNFSVATNKFNVTASNGNTTLAGTLAIGGALSGVTTLSMGGAISGVTAPTVQKFTSGVAQTYTLPASCVRIRVRMIGGGGGGGARATNSGTSGGNSGFFGNAWIAALGTGGTLAGAGGAGGSGGADGTGTLVVRIAGQDGGVSTMQTDATGDSQSVFVGGTGGCSAFGGGGAQGAVSGGAAKANSGGGGAGGNSSITTKGGGGGGAGEYVEFWMTAAQVGASTTYTVGAKGTGGAAGGSAGGDGAAGIIIVEEFYS